MLEGNYCWKGAMLVNSMRNHVIMDFYSAQPVKLIIPSNCWVEAFETMAADAVAIIRAGRVHAQQDIVPVCAEDLEEATMDNRQHGMRKASKQLS